MDIRQLDRIAMFCLGLGWGWVIWLYWTKMIPEVKELIQSIKKDSTDGTAESETKISC